MPRDESRKCSPLGGYVAKTKSVWKAGPHTRSLIQAGQSSPSSSLFSSLMYRVKFTPTVPHCSMATLIGLCIRVRLLRCLPPRFKVHILVGAWNTHPQHIILVFRSSVLAPRKEIGRDGNNHTLTFSRHASWCSGHPWLSRIRGCSEQAADGQGEGGCCSREPQPL